MIRLKQEAHRKLKDMKVTESRKAATVADAEMNKL